MKKKFPGPFTAVRDKSSRLSYAHFMLSARFILKPWYENQYILMVFISNIRLGLCIYLLSVLFWGIFRSGFYNIMARHGKKVYKG